MLNRFILDEIMKLEPNGDDISCFSSLAIFNRYDLDVDLLTNEHNELFYSVKVPKVLLSEISTDDLINIRNAGWEYSEDKQFIIKKI